MIKKVQVTHLPKSSVLYQFFHEIHWLFEVFELGGLGGSLASPPSTYVNRQFSDCFEIFKIVESVLVNKIKYPPNTDLWSLSLFNS
jgi:hypothetical protein